MVVVDSNDNCGHRYNMNGLLAMFKIRKDGSDCNKNNKDDDRIELMIWWC